MRLSYSVATGAWQLAYVGQCIPVQIEHRPCFGSSRLTPLLMLVLPSTTTVRPRLAASLPQQPHSPPLRTPHSTDDAARVERRLVPNHALSVVPPQSRRREVWTCRCGRHCSAHCRLPYPPSPQPPLRLPASQFAWHRSPVRFLLSPEGAVAQAQPQLSSRQNVGLSASQLAAAQ